jgi:prepilin-type processing-associated H-X9-DG protein
VVITIIGILIAMLLPAVQAARESARRVQCQNNLKQIGLGCLSHEHVQKFFPSGGWHYRYVGDPDCGFGATQPGGWIYSILPFIEQNALWGLGAGEAAAAKKADARTVCHTPLALMNCPSRRRAIIYPFAYASGDLASNAAPNDPADNVCAKADYAVCSATGFGTSESGVSFARSEVAAAAVHDGLSNTYLVGEKNQLSDHYTTGACHGDNETMYSGVDDDTMRLTSAPSYPPRPDYPNVQHNLQFGSAHANGFNMVFCDGSVHSISYSIDPNLHSYLGDRKDRQTIDAGRF